MQVVATRPIRRSALVVLLLAGTAACTIDGAAGGAPTATLPAGIFPRPASTSGTRIAPWQPTPREPAVEVKIAAARAVEALLSYAEGDGTAAAAAARATSLGLAGRLGTDVAPLLVPSARGWVDVVYPQLGGLTPTAASVMVVTRIVVAVGDEARATVRTLDVRLQRTPGGWRTDAIASVGGAPATTADAPTRAKALLDAERVDLPDSAIWDLEAGVVDQRLVDLLVALAADYDLGVAVFASGHPVNVFDRDVMSNHTLGRAVDIWEINGVPVAEQQQSAAVRAVATRAVAAGLTEVGAPFDMDGVGGSMFTNTVHMDHLHLAFDAPAPPSTATIPQRPAGRSG